jgi:hypothetical protein
MRTVAKLSLGLLATALMVTQVIGTESIVRRDWAAKNFEAYLPAPTTTVPWLDIDSRTTMPRIDFPIGWKADRIRPLVLRLQPVEYAELGDDVLGGPH